MGDATSGTGVVDHYLIDTHLFFERFVVGLMREAGAPRWLVRPKKLGYLARDSVGPIFQFENDAIIVDRNLGRTIVVDMKYKSVDLTDRDQKFRISQSDLYQMVSYAVRRGVTDVLLVYPTTGVQDASGQRLAVDLESSGETIAITACMISMTDTSATTIWRELSEALEVERVQLPQIS